MPIPQPKKGESQDDFIARFMSNSEMKKDYPEQKQRLAVAYSTWRKKNESFLLEFAVPISIKEHKVEEGFKDFTIQGIAISETTTLNNHKYIAEELEKATPTLVGKPLLTDHEQKVENIVGKVTNALWNPAEKRIDFEAKIMDEKIKEMVIDGRLSSVSVGAFAKDLTEAEDGSFIAKGIQFAELSLVPCPADSHATFVMAMMEAFKLREQMMKCPECGYEGEMEKMDMKDKKMKNHESYSSIQDEKMKGGQNMETITEDQTKVIAELTKQLDEYKAKERKSLEESYKKLCQEKKVKELDISKMSDEAIVVLKEQISSVKISEEKSEIVEEKKDDGFVVERFGKGFALWKK